MVVKQAQSFLEGFELDELGLGLNDEEAVLAVGDAAQADDVSALNDSAFGEGVVSIQVDGDEPITEEFTFELPKIPGGEFQEEIDEPAEILVEEPEDVIEVEQDPWKWTLGGFLNWLQSMMTNIPGHSGRDTVGIERAIAYMEALDREISRACRSDLKGELPINLLAKARDNINDGIERLNERLEEIKSTKYPKRKGKGKGKGKKAESEEGLVKEAQKAAKFTVVVPLFISSMARTCINSMVSAGKDIEDCFFKIVKSYDLTKREQAELVQLLSDMGYPMRRPRGHDLDEEIDYTSTDNLDWSAQYPA
jgi:hypothetical protein